MHLRRAALLLIAVSGAADAACFREGAASPSIDASADGSVDATPGPDSGASEDAGRDVTTAAQDAGSTDASDAATDGNAPGDATADTADAADGADAAEAGPLFDDAGCPVGTGVVASAADAGLPSTGISLWLRADMGVATTDGGVVCRWDDVSGNARAFVPGTTTGPVVDPTGIRGRPGVSFAAPGQHLVRNDVLGLGATSGRTVAVYGRNADTTHRFEYFEQGAPGTGGTYFGIDTNTFQTVGSREGVYVTNNGYDSDVATSTNARSHLYSISSFAPGGSLPGVLSYAVDGTPTTLTRTPGGTGNGTVEDFSAASTTWIGAATTGFTGAELGELLVYDHALTALQQTAVDQYFRARFP